MGRMNRAGTARSSCRTTLRGCASRGRRRRGGASRRYRTRSTTPRRRGRGRGRSATSRTRTGTSFPTRSTRSSASSRRRTNQGTSLRSYFPNFNTPPTIRQRDTTFIRVYSRTSLDITLTRIVSSLSLSCTNPSVRAGPNKNNGFTIKLAAF